MFDFAPSFVKARSPALALQMTKCSWLALSPSFLSTPNIVHRNKYESQHNNNNSRNILNMPAVEATIEHNAGVGQPPVKEAGGLDKVYGVRPKT